MGLFNFSFTKRESIGPDLDKLESIKPKVEELAMMVEKANEIEDTGILRGEMVQIEEKLREVTLALQNTAHGQKYFREIDSIDKDSLESAQDMLPYVHTPLENFHRIKQKISVLNQRIENASHQDLFAD
jgi:hypothetical protein